MTAAPSARMSTRHALTEDTAVTRLEQTSVFRRLVSEHVHVLPAYLVVTIVFGWFVTYGTWRFFERESFGTFYDAQAKSLLEGRLDVAPVAISGEAFVRDGKSYGYFGIAPALLRLPLNLLLPGMEGKWSRTFMTAACVLNLVYGYLLFGMIGRLLGFPLSQVRLFVRSLFILLIGLGSTNVFLAGRSFVYHEAIIWGATFALIFYYYIVRYMERPKMLTLVAACAFFFLSVFSRPSVGAGTFLVCTLLFLSLVLFHVARKTDRPLYKTIADKISGALGMTRTPIPGIHAICLGAFLFCALSLYSGINYAKFATLVSRPLRLSVQYNPKRLEKLGEGKSIYFNSVRANLLNYFGRNLRLRNSFPWISMRRDATVFQETKMDRVEPFSSIPASMPALSVLSLAGLYALLVPPSPNLKKLRLPAIGALSGGSSILLHFAISERYLHDYYPFLVLAGAVGLHWILLLRPISSKVLLLFIVLPLTILSIVTNFAFALTYQREIIFGVAAAKRVEFRVLRSKIDGLFSWRPLEVHRGAEPKDPLPGQIWIGDDESVLWYNGNRWIWLRRGVSSGLIRARVSFRPQPEGVYEPLVVTGRTGAGDFVLVQYLSGGRIRFKFDHWGTGGDESDPITVEPGHLYNLEVDLDRPNRMVTVKLDGREVLQQYASLYSTTRDQITIGENRIGPERYQNKFSGRIIVVEEPTHDSPPVGATRGHSHRQ